MIRISAIFFFLGLNLSVSALENVAAYLTGNGYGGINTFAIIIANEDYQSYSEGYIRNEELAIYQAERFQQMLIKGVGVLPENIFFYADATNTHIKLAIAKVQKQANSKSKIVFYYRGKVFRENPDSELFLVPIDTDGQESFFMLGLADLHKRLGNLNVASTGIFIDALPGKSSGSACIFDEGFVTSNIHTQNAKNPEYFTLQSTTQAVIIPEPDISLEKAEIRITNPAETSISTSESAVLISGEYKSLCPVSIVAINGEEANLMQDGTFAARVVLSEGENKIAIEVNNCAGWSREYLNITRLIFPCDSMEDDAEADNPDVSEPLLQPEGINYALLIGVSQYKDAMMPNLFYPVKDAKNIKEILISKYAFNAENVIFLQSPGKAEIILTLDSLSKLLKPEDSFLMFYAGHGSWDEKSRMGYWLPADAAAEMLDNWIMNSIITGYASTLNAKHVLVIADACFSGSIFRTRAFKTEEEKNNMELYKSPSRKAMTSGDLTEVPDESIFMRCFAQKLEENTSESISSEKLFYEVKPMVVNTIDLIPQFGIIKNAGDEGGDYIFFKK